MIVFIQPLDSSIAGAKIRGNPEAITQIRHLLTKFDQVAILTQDTMNFTHLFPEFTHVPCAFSNSRQVRSILSRFRYLRWFYSFLSCFHWLLKHRGTIDLIISGNIDSPVPLFFSRIFRVPYVIHYHYDVAFQVKEINRHPIIGTLLLGLERFAFSRVSAVWVTSPSLVSKVKTFGARRIRVIPNWVDITEIEEGQAETVSKKRLTGRVLFVGRLHRVKQVDLLIRAFHQLHKTNPNIDMYILGDGEERQNLIKLTSDLGLSDSVHFLGFVNRKTTFEMMKQSDVLVLPSKVEGNPRALIEGMMNKVPIVATNVPGIKDMVQHMKTGYLIHHSQPEELAHAIEYVLRNKQNSANIVKRAYAFAKQNFSKESVSQKIISELVLLVPKYRAKIDPCFWPSPTSKTIMKKDLAQYTTDP